MDEQFDKKLTNHIRGVFDDYEHPGDANEGWMKLRESFPPETGAKKVARLWWSSAAAILLLALGIGLWVKNTNTPVKNYADNTAVKPLTKDSVAANDAAINKAAANNVAIEQPAAKQNNTQPKHDPLNNNKFNTYAQQAPRVVPGVSNKFIDIPVIVPATVPATVDAPQKANAIGGTNPYKVATDSQKVANSSTNQQQIANAQTPFTADKKEKAASIVALKPQPKTIIEMLEADKQNQPDKKEVKENRDKKVNFSIYAATYFNYAEGSANQVNAGAGFTSDIKLSRKIKLSTGVALAQNTLRYNNSLPPSNGGGGAAAFAASASPNIKQSDLFNVAGEVPVFRNYNASLIGLDVPINIKYEFNPDKSDTYISAGLSSGTFIDEKYTYSYTYSNNRTATPQNATTTNSFNSFYFGKTLNVSFGVGYPLGKSNRLIIEPFLKYPLDGLGAQQLRFGAGGLNLKINFKGRK